MFVHAVEKPERVRKSKYLTPLRTFMESDNKTLKFSCSNNNEAISCMASIGSFNNAKNLGLVIWKKNYDVYVIKG